MLVPATLSLALLALPDVAVPARAFGPGRIPLAVHFPSAARDHGAPGSALSPLYPQLTADSAEAHARARTLQFRFERRRVRQLPRTLGGGSRRCDEIIGRLCIWDDGDDGWVPREEPEEIAGDRAELLASLDSLAGAIPGDHWVFGQRIRYLAEAGRLADAESMARSCDLPQRWRCDAYLGFVNHRQERFRASESAFRQALEAMPGDIRAEWTDPGVLLGGELRDWLSVQPDSLHAVDRLWTLADPLFLVAGNDRRTAHLARWVYAMSSEGARSPHQLRWGRDLTEAVVRYGWPIAWESSWPRGGEMSFSVTGRDPPAALRTFPPREVLGRGPSGEEPVRWEIEDGHSRSVHLPPYLDSLGALDGQVGRFWRRDGVVVVAAWAVPDIALEEAAGSEAVASIAGPDRAGRAPVDGSRLSQVEVGLFVEQEGLVAAIVRGKADPGGAVRLSERVGWSDWGVVSLEAWLPERRRAYRLRAGLGLVQLPPDLLAISDLMLLEQGTEPNGFGEMPGMLKAVSEAGPDEALGVAFEVYGLGSRSEPVDFSAWVEKRGEGLLTRAVRWLGIAGPKEVVSLRWREAGPSELRPLFRTFQVGLPGLDPGEYEVVVEVSVAGRSPLSGRRIFRVR